jgi:predicted porin
VQNLFRFNAVYSITPEIRLKSRIDVNYFTTVDGQKTSGYLFYEDLVLKKQNSPITITMRYALFDINGYNSRIYALESDLPFAYTFLAYNGKGNRFYAMVNYDVNKRTEVWIRYGQTFLLNQSTLNTGTPSESVGPVRSELKLQIRYKF